MPLGVLTDNLMVALGGLLGGILGSRVSDKLKENLNLAFGFVAIGIGVTLVIKVNLLGAVVLSVIFGVLIGTALNLEDHIQGFFAGLNEKILKKAKPEEAYMSRFTTLLVLCCCSGTGIFGSMNEALTGDRTIILCKAILDFFTVMIFATMLGKFTAIIALPQMAILLTLFFSAKLIMPGMSEELIRDFSAVGGIVELMIGFRILRLSKLHAIDALPSLVLIFPISYLWQLIF